MLDGVTGSGKTEVYFEAVARTLEKGRQALIMLPEIALTSQFMDRFTGRFGCAPVEWHSALSAPERARAWRAAATGEARVVVGARSALFLPYADLGLIVVDEEHDQGFKQEDRVHYQARDMAVVRASLGRFPAVLASATPSVESHVNARTGRYAHVALPGRYSGTELPDVSAIDMRSTPPDKGRWLAPPAGRGGCRNAGAQASGPALSQPPWLRAADAVPLLRASLRLPAVHRLAGRAPLPAPAQLPPLRLLPAAARDLPEVRRFNSLVACGPGVERIAEEVAERFPDARLALLSSDLIPGLTEMRALIKSIEAGEVDIIIGTQMVAKGHHFPDLATVGIVDGDLGLGTADPRAAERTFQLLHQVTGRAGRVLAGTGRGLVQTYMPEHPVMQAIISGDREAFLAREIRQRQAGLLPPYGRLAAIVISARDKELAELFARDVARRAPPAERIEVLGPAEAPLAIIRGRYRWRLLIKAPRELDVQAYLRTWLAALPKAPADLRLTVDIDPYNFL